MREKYINKRMVIAINKLSIELAGGTGHSNNVRPGMSLGFVENIHTNELFGAKIYPDIFHQAAAYMFYIIKNHVFHDGNKRTGLATAITLLNWNGIQFRAFEEDAVFDFVMDIASGKNEAQENIERIALWLREMSE
ncbi:type II toxin-antitoxin system death-on-curing family toxin [Candidatus Uabimicrobium amorphum]|uniref:Death-on-curing protein n=1 Tax=Uabimicrobium amorphum TaxID=2596890 RepID=A0A5S9ILX3_UABAM|nr:type II toxin-antitoxin system death-on-curing family toxin [Candidatus Uabimicrobium amorphum]BBM83846.1 death-on-curing protein [Candidatus Uabimicrobium amorphum]